MGFGHTKWKKLRTMSELSKQTKTNILGTHEGKIVKKLVRKIQRSPLSAWGTISTKGGNIVKKKWAQFVEIHTDLIQQ